MANLIKDRRRSSLTACPVLTVSGLVCFFVCYMGSFFVCFSKLSQTDSVLVLPDISYSDSGLISLHTHSNCIFLHGINPGIFPANNEILSSRNHQKTSQEVAAAATDHITNKVLVCFEAIGPRLLLKSDTVAQCGQTRELGNHQGIQQTKSKAVGARKIHKGRPA